MSDVIFISYAKEDNKKANELYKRLKSKGFNPWIDDHDLLPGYNWDKEIKSAISSSRVFLLVVSSKVLSKRGYIQKEIKTALEYAETFPEGDIYFIPIRIEECEVPESIQKWQWVDLFKYGGFNKLVNAIEKAVPRNQSTNKIRKEVEIDMHNQMLKERILYRGRLFIFSAKNKSAISDGVYVELVDSVPDEISSLREKVITFTRGSNKTLNNVWPKTQDYRTKDNLVVHIELDNKSSERVFIYNEDKSKKSAMNIKYFNLAKSKYDDIKIYMQDPINGNVQPLVVENKSKAFALIMPMITT